MDSYIPPPVDYLAPVWPPTRIASLPFVGPVDWKDIVPIALRAFWLTRPTAERAESARTFASVAASWNDRPPRTVAGSDGGPHSSAVGQREINAQLDMTADLITRLIDAKLDHPELMSTVAALQVALEEKAGPKHADHVRERFQCILGSLGLIPSDNEGERY